MIDLEAAEQLADQFILDDAHDIVSNAAEISQTIRELVAEVKALRKVAKAAARANHHNDQCSVYDEADCDCGSWKLGSALAALPD